MAKEAIYDPKLNPILVDVLALGVEDNKEAFLGRLTILGDLLIPHAQTLSNSISIGDFIPMDIPVSIEKRQYWSFVVVFNEGQINEQSCEVEKTDMHNGDGVRLRVNIIRRGEKFGQFSLTNSYSGYVLASYSENSEGIWHPSLILEKKKRGWTKKPWELTVDEVDWSKLGELASHVIAS